MRIYNPIATILAKSIIIIHLDKTINTGPSENTNAYIKKQINQNTISHISVTPILVLAMKFNGFTGKLR